MDLILGLLLELVAPRKLWHLLLLVATVMVLWSLYDRYPLVFGIALITIFFATLAFLAFRAAFGEKPDPFEVVKLKRNET